MIEKMNKEMIEREQHNQKRIMKLNEEIERLKEEYRITCEQKNIYISALEGSLGIAEERYLKLKNIIKEAIEYIKGNEEEYGSLEDNEKIILDILRGEIDEKNK